MNRKHLIRLSKLTYKVDDCPALDEYSSKIFGRPVGNTWRLYRYIARIAVADIWLWNTESEVASYPKDIEVPSFEEFATFLLHEAAHGLCHFYRDNPFSRDYPTGVDEEQVCWDISRLVCDFLGIVFQEKLANLCYQSHVAAKRNDMKEVARIEEILPPHIQYKNPR